MTMHEQHITNLIFNRVWRTRFYLHMLQCVSHNNHKDQSLCNSSKDVTV